MLFYREGSFTKTYDQFIKDLRIDPVGSKNYIEIVNIFKSILPSGLNIFTIEDLVEYITNYSDSLNIRFKTSGTTGEPKFITQIVKNLIRHFKKTKNDLVWGFCYSPHHIAGIQVLFQIVLNKNTLIYLFNKDFKSVENDIFSNRVTNISCTPTFMKMLLPYLNREYKLNKVTFGGERLNNYIVDSLKKRVPGIEIRNVYASTEAGSILASDGELFYIPETLKNLVKINDGEICIHHSLLGSFENYFEWFKTGDFVDYITPDKFRIVARESEIINTGGYRVSLGKVEEVLLEQKEVKDCVVYTRDSSVLGKIICVKVVTDSDLKGIKSIIKKLSSLKQYEKPQYIEIVQKLDLTETGKVKRV